MNININMSAILGKAWKITWKYKILWIFGMLASFNEGGRSGFNNGGSNGGSGYNPNNGNFPDPFGNNAQDAIFAFLNQYGLILMLVFCVVLVLGLLFYFLGTVGKAGLIYGAYKADQDVEKLTFGELWREGARYFWRMFGLSLLVGLPFLIIGLVLGVIFLVGLATMVGGNQETGTRAMGALFGALGIFIPALCCLGLVWVFVRMIVEQAKNAMVIKDLGVMESLRQGWTVFKGNFLTIILMSIILGVLATIAVTIISIPLLLIVLPAVISTFVILGAAGTPDSTNIGAAFAPLAFAGICFVAYLPVLFFLRGVVLTYTQSALTLTYLRLTAPAPASVAETINAE